jgi:hypothetical protein
LASRNGLFLRVTALFQEISINRKNNFTISKLDGLKIILSIYISKKVIFNKNVSRQRLELCLRELISSQDVLCKYE